MRTSFVLTACVLAAGLLGCSSEADDDAVTDDSAEIVEGRSFLERELSPPIDPPRPAVIGKKTSDVLAEATGGATSAGRKSVGDGCTVEAFEDAAKKVIAEREVCKSSEVVRLVGDDGKALTTWSDLNKDGKIDRFSGEDGAYILYADADFDGVVDQTIERIDRIDDFSLKGYGESYPKSKFLHRVREDSDKDGKLDYEKLVSKGLLPPAQR